MEPGLALGAPPLNSEELCTPRHSTGKLVLTKACTYFLLLPQVVKCITGASWGRPMWHLGSSFCPLPRGAPQSRLEAELLGRVGFHSENPKLSFDGEEG